MIDSAGPATRVAGPVVLQAHGAFSIIAPMPAAVGDASLHSRLAGLPEPTCFVPPIDARSTRRFGLVLLLTPLVLALLWPFLTLAWVNHYDDGQVAFVAGLYSRKHVAATRAAERAAATNRPRLVVIGGSGSLSGIDAELIELKLGIPTVNMAAHAGLSPEYLLYRARQEIRPGDVVLLSPEHELWDYPADRLTDLAWGYATSYDTAFFAEMPRGRALRMMYSVPLQDYYGAVRGWRKRLAGNHHRTRPNYDCGSLSPNGDLRMQLPRSPFPPPTHFPFPDVRAARSVPFFRGFLAWAKSNDVRVLLTWPNMCRPEPMPISPADEPPAELMAMLAELNVTVLDTPTQTLYPPQWFRDTVYHPDAGCRRVRTEALARRLRPHLGLPEAPPEPTGLFLVAGAPHLPDADSAFAADAGVQTKYLSAEPIDHPDAITPEQLQQYDARGLPVYCNDPEVAALLEARGWRTADAHRTTATLADWAKRYDRHLFLIAGTGGAGVPPDGWPSEVAAALAARLPFAAVVGTGPWSSVKRVSRQRVESELRSLVRAAVPQLSLEGRASPDGRGVVVVNRAERAVGLGLAVVVVDVEMGIVVDAATFPPDGTPLVTRRLLRLTRAL
jgi:hypothetical protein